MQGMYMRHAGYMLLELINDQSISIVVTYKNLMQFSATTTVVAMLVIVIWLGTDAWHARLDICPHLNAVSVNLVTKK